MSELKDAGTLIRLAYQGLLAMGVDADAVLVRSGLKTEQLYDSQLRTSHAAQLLFWKASEELSNDPDIGLHLGEHMPLFKGQILEYLFFSSANFGEGLKRMLNYQRLISDAIKANVVETSPLAYITFDFPEMPLRHLIECMTSVWIKFLKFVGEDRFAPVRIDFRHQISDNHEDYQRIYGCEVVPNQAENRIYFPFETLSYRSLHTQPELFSVHEQIASQQLASIKRQDLINDVQQHVASLLESGEVSLETVAKRLTINPRNLRSQLAEAGTSFSQVLNDYRHQLAKRLLAKTDESIAEIVYLTGFSEPSTFYRAFKRWEGLTPVEYRRRKQEAAAGN
jgi:AraC-like DNA-binding protein